MSSHLHQYSLFVSCGAEDRLRDLRDVCLQASWEAGHSATSFLSAIARGDAQQEIRHSDIVVRLCSTPDESVRRECFWAIDSGKPVLLLVLGSNVELAEYKSILESAPAGSCVHNVGGEPYVFAKEYLVALHQIVRFLDAASSSGFWTAHGSDPYIRNPFWRRFASRVNQWATLDWRFTANASLKRAAAEFFLEQYLEILSKGQISRLFFESGSSIAFLSQAFAERLDEPSLKQWADLHIETNNIVSYMEFILNQFTQVALYPAGPPERKYGGTFGKLKDLTVPAEGAHPIKDLAYELMCRIRDHFAEQYVDLGIILGATSGIDLTRGRELVGPHVGSYWNMLFKRALLESGAPVALFLDEDKLTRPVIPGQCFLVCDTDFTWHYACHNVPLALVCAFRTEERGRTIIPDLQYFGLEHLEFGRRGEAPWPVIVSNSLFQERRRAWLDIARGEARPDKSLSVRRVVR